MEGPRCATGLASAFVSLKANINFNRNERIQTSRIWAAPVRRLGENDATER
jgi:hypothetical protein